MAPPRSRANRRSACPPCSTRSSRLPLTAGSPASSPEPMPRSPTTPQSGVATASSTGSPTAPPPGPRPDVFSCPITTRVARRPSTPWYPRPSALTDGTSSTEGSSPRDKHQTKRSDLSQVMLTQRAAATRSPGAARHSAGRNLEDQGCELHPRFGTTTSAFCCGSVPGSGGYRAVHGTATEWRRPRGSVARRLL
jgi:hypothetical protein